MIGKFFVDNLLASEPGDKADDDLVNLDVLFDFKQVENVFCRVTLEVEGGGEF